MINIEGRRGVGFQSKSLDGVLNVPLPTFIECDHMADDHYESPTPEAAWHFENLKPIAHEIPSIDPTAQILLLLGRDIHQSVTQG